MTSLSSWKRYRKICVLFLKVVPTNILFLLFKRRSLCRKIFFWLLKRAFRTWFSFPQHPGGEEVFLANAGQDATDCFDAIGHSEEAKSLMKGFKIGTLAKVITEFFLNYYILSEKFLKITRRSSVKKKRRILISHFFTCCLCVSIFFYLKTRRFLM